MNPFTPPEIRISVERGKAVEANYSFTAPFKIGRDAECEVRLADSKVSRVHAEVRFVRDKWLLLDLQSTNGTFIDGRREERFELSDGMRVEFGRDGPVLAFSIARPVQSPRSGATSLSADEYMKHYFEARTDQQVGAHTQMIRAVYGQLQKNRSEDSAWS